MIADRDVRKAVETLVSEIEAQESQIAYLNREVDRLILGNNTLDEEIQNLQEENTILRLKISKLEQELTEMYLTGEASNDRTSVDRKI